MESIQELQAKIDALEAKKKKAMEAETKMIGAVAQQVFKGDLTGKSKAEVKAFLTKLAELYRSVPEQPVVSAMSAPEFVKPAPMPAPVGVSGTEGDV